MENDKEKQRRIYYQDLVYHACNVIDSVLGGTTTTGTSEDPGGNFKERCKLLRERAKLDKDTNT